MDSSKSDKLSEAELVQRSQQNDLDSFNCLVEIYQPQVYNLALRLLGETGAAEDATQEVFIAAWRGIAKFKGGNFKAWLLHITANACHDQLRRRRRHPEISLESLPVEPQDSTYSVEEALWHQELNQQIQEGLAKLPEHQRLAIILCDIQELTYEETAKVMHCSIGTVKSRLNRGRSQLRDYLRERGIVP